LPVCVGVRNKLKKLTKMAGRLHSRPPAFARNRGPVGANLGA
jgi:hypothetical protein